MVLEFTSTECVRPGIMRMGYQSFVKNLKGVNFKKSTLYLNVDPVPTPNTKVMGDVAREFFGNVIMRGPKTPNFCRAVKWCWSQPKGPYFFHLESDWVLKVPIRIKTMIGILNRPKICAVNLRAYPKKAGVLCLSPGLLNTKIARGIAVKLNPKLNPEQQFRPPSNKCKHGRNLQPAGFRSVHIPAKVVIVDIGRAWLKKSKLRRGGASFNSWIKT